MKQTLIENLYKESPVKTISMVRVEYGSSRLYATKNPVRLYSGLTRTLDDITFKGNKDAYYLNKWRDQFIADFGQKAQEQYLQATADFGSLVHQVILRIWHEGKINWQQEQEYAFEFFRASATDNGLTPNENIIEQQVFEYCKAAASLMYFIYENVSELYAIEAMCKSDEHSIATPVDLVFKHKKGYTAVVNIKTSEKFYDKHREQVIVEKFMWNETYDLKIERCGLLRQKDWNMKKIPTYEYEVVEENSILQDTLEKLTIARRTEKNTYLKFPKEKLLFAGETKLGEQPKFETKKIEDIIFEPKFEKELLTI